MSERDLDGGSTPSPETPSPEQRRALFRVVRGEPSDAEVAALTVVLAAITAGATDPSAADPSAAAGATPTRDLWSDPAARLRTPLHPGPGAWRSSAWPR